MGGVLTQMESKLQGYGYREECVESVLQKYHHPWRILHEEDGGQNERTNYEGGSVETAWQALVFHVGTKLNSILNRLRNTNFIVNCTRSWEVRVNGEGIFL